MTNSPRWFKVVAFLAVAWNLLGCAAFVSDLRLTPQDVANLPSPQQALYAARPAWAVAATGVAVIGGVLGSLGLLLGRTWALPLLLLSLLGVLVQDANLFLLSNGTALAGAVAMVMQALVLAIAIALVWLARVAKARHWLR